MVKTEKTVLVVEDDPIIRDLVRLGFKRLDCRVIIARDGYEGLMILQSHRPTLILLDILLPHVNGLDILKFVTNDEELQKTPVVIMSALGYQEIVEKAMLMGAADFIVKPFKVDSFSDRMLGILEKWPGEIIDQKSNTLSP